MKKAMVLFVVVTGFTGVSPAAHKDLAYHAAKKPAQVASYPMRHPVKDVHAVKCAGQAVGSAAYRVARFVL